MVDEKRNPFSDAIGSQETVLGHAPISPGLSPSGVRSKRHGIPLPFLRKRTYRSSCSMAGQPERPSVFPRPFRLSATMRNGSRLPGILVPFFAVRRMPSAAEANNRWIPMSTLVAPPPAPPARDSAGWTRKNAGGMPQDPDFPSAVLCKVPV